MKTLRIAIAGTTKRTVECAEALLKSGDFAIPWVLTPEPKAVGRKKIVTPNPVQQFAENHTIPVIHLTTKITNSVRTSIENHSEIDFLLVVDFGYIVPNWLLQLPKVAPLNIHPSALPKWRGSSPGQFALLYGEQTSAVSLIKMNDKLDQGPIIAALSFAVDPTWAAEDYYEHSFMLMSEQLTSLLKTYASTLEETPQPLTSPTATAIKISKQDAFIPWELLKKAQRTPHLQLADLEVAELSPLLAGAVSAHSCFAELVVAAVRALSPWPKVWTFIETTQGKKRMQIHSTTSRKTSQGLILELGTVQIEGQSPALFNQVKNSIAE